MSLSEILLPYQKELVKHPANAKVIVRKSRRTGYTWAQALRMVMDISIGQPWNIISYRMESSKLVIDDCRDWIMTLTDLGLIDSSEFECLKNTVTYLPSNTTIRALPCVARTIRGKKGNVLIDEAAHIPNLAEILDAVRPLSIWGYGITMISSPYLPGLFEELSQSDEWIVVSTDIYEAVAQGLYHKIRATQSRGEPTELECQEWIEGLIREAGKSASHEYLCRTVSDNRAGWISEHSQLLDLPVVYPIEPFANPSMRVSKSHVLGIDVGVADNPTCISVVSRDGLERLFELREKTIPEIARFVESLTNHQTQSIVIDTNGIGRGLADILKESCKAKIIYCPNTSQWFSSECVKFLSGVWYGTYQISKDATILEDLASVELLGGKLVLNSRSVNGIKRHCDFVPSLAMAYQYQPKRESMYLD